MPANLRRTVCLVTLLTSGCAEQLEDAGSGSTVDGGAASTTTAASTGSAAADIGETEGSAATSGGDDASTSTHESSGIQDEATSSVSTASGASSDDGATTSDASDEDSGSQTESGGVTTHADVTGTDTATDSASTTSDDADTDERLRALTDAICAWSFNCCEDGEFDVIMGPFADGVGGCSQRLFEMLHVVHSHISADDRRLLALGHRMPDFAFVLAHLVELEYSRVRNEGLEACIEAWEAEDCRQPPSHPVRRCDDEPLAQACRLDRIFEGRLIENAFCYWEFSGPFTDIQCGPGLSCQPYEPELADDVSSYRCVRKQVLGEACTPPVEGYDDTLQRMTGPGGCDWGLYCDPERARCLERPGLGQACRYRIPDHPRVDQLRIPCQHGLYCDPANDRCVDSCSEGYACGSRVRGAIVHKTGPSWRSRDDRMLHYPTPGFAPPSDDQDRCPTGLSCRPHRNDPAGATPGEQPGDPYYYLGKGSDRFGTSFECRPPGAEQALCDSHGDCVRGYYCDKPIGEPTLGHCRAQQGPGEACFVPPEFVAVGGLRNGELEHADARCPEGHYCDLSIEPDRSGKRAGQCRPKLAADASCHRHAECDAHLGLGLCIASDDGPAGPGLARAGKRCARRMIPEGALCAPRAGLGSNAPFPILRRGAEQDPPGHRDVVGPGHGMMVYAPAPSGEGEIAGQIDRIFKAGLSHVHFPRLWQGPEQPFSVGDSGAVRVYDSLVRRASDAHAEDRVLMDRAHEDAEHTDEVEVGLRLAGAEFLWWWGMPSDSPARSGSTAEAHPFLRGGVDISGGVDPAYAWMQTMAMNLRQDFVSFEDRWTKLSYAATSSPGNPQPALSDHTTRSDFRHLASHCAAGKDLVCQRDPDDVEAGHPFRCLAGVALGDACDSDPGTFGEERGSCAPGLECFEGHCVAQGKPGAPCKKHEDERPSSRCEWRSRRPIMARIPCPDSGDGVQCRATPGDDAGEGPWLIDPITQDFATYIHAWDDGCRTAHRQRVCGLTGPQVGDRSYCDGRD